MVAKIMSVALVCLIILSLSLLLRAGKDKDVRKRPTTRATGNLADDPVSRSIAQWQKRSLEVLRLDCEQVHLVSSGSRAVLARRLYEHYHRSSSSAPGPSSSRSSIPPPLSVNNPPLLVINPPPINPPPSVNNDVNSSISSDLLNNINFQTLLRDEFKNFLANNVIAPPAPLVTDPLAPQSVLPVVGNMLHDFHNGTTTTPDVRSSAVPVVAAPIPLHESLFNSLMQPSPLNISSSGLPSSSTLPPLPQNILDQIKAGKFVKFDDLLPAISPLNNDNYSIQINSASGGEPSVSLVPNRRNRPRIIDFHTWLTAWNSYLQAMIFYHPTRVTELIHYQSVFTRFASQYSFSACFAYDRLFRHSMANNPSLSWARVDDDLFNRFLRGAPLRTQCFSCRNYGHMATNCPLRNNAPQSPATRSPISAPTNPQVSNQPFRAPQTGTHQSRFHQSRQTCRYFNQGQCTYSVNCQYAHKCRNCFGDHPQSNCPSRSFKQQ